LILALPGVQLNKSAVRVREIATTGTTAEALADVGTAFRFKRSKTDETNRQDAADAWTVVEVRVGDRQWEDVELLSRALKSDGRAPVLTVLETLAAEFAASARAEQEKQRKQSEPETEGKGKKEKKKKQDEKAENTNELRRDGVLVKDSSALLSSSILEAEVETGFRFTKEGGRWRVAEIRVGAGAWQSTDALVAALDAEKNALARADLETIRTALEAFRRERGFYVVAADQSVLVDHLSPRYLSRILRIDPWHRPYKYDGTTTRYTLASDGPDGKPGTPDDIRIDN
jgi:hypothetical protein